MKRSADLLDLLAETLDTLTAAHRDFLKAAQLQRQAVISINSQGVEQSMETETDAASRIRTANERRMQLQSAIATALKMDPKTPLGQLLMRLKEDVRVANLEKKRLTLKALSMQVQTINATNGFLIGESLKSTQGILGILTGFNPKDQCYSRNGRQYGRSQRHLVDRQA